MAASRGTICKTAAHAWRTCRKLNPRYLPFLITQTRGKRYDEKGMTLPNRIPLGWRNVDHNPANIPSAWIPDNWYEENTIDYEREKELAKYIPGYEPKLRDEEHPNYHSEPVYHFGRDTKLVEGLKHALNIIKCVLIEDLPQQIQELSENISIPNQDDRVIQVFRHSLLFDIDPRNLDKFKKYKEHLEKINPLIDRSCPTILENMMRLCQSESHKYPNLLRRLRSREVESCATFRRGYDMSRKTAEHLEKNWKILLSGSEGTQLLSTTPLQPFASKAEVRDTESMSLPDIFPVFPVVDLKKTHVYEEINSTGFKPGFTHGHLHTLVIPNVHNFSAEEMYAKMATNLFACLFSRAVNMYGDQPMNLPTPLMGQCIASDGQNYQFLCMQVNTTMLQDDSGIKNMVWIEQREEEIEEYGLKAEARPTYKAIPMFSACSHRVWQSPEYYTDYDPMVFQTFLALWMNGAT